MRKTILAMAAVASLASFAGCDEADPASAHSRGTAQHIDFLETPVVMLQAGEWEMDFYRRPRFVVTMRNMQNWTVPFRVVNIEAAKNCGQRYDPNLRVLAYDALAAWEQKRQSLERYRGKVAKPPDYHKRPKRGLQKLRLQGSDSRTVHTDETYDAYQSYTPATPAPRRRRFCDVSCPGAGEPGRVG